MQIVNPINPTIVSKNPPHNLPHATKLTTPNHYTLQYPPPRVTMTCRPQRATATLHIFKSAAAQRYTHTSGTQYMELPIDHRPLQKPLQRLPAHVYLQHTTAIVAGEVATHDMISNHTLKWGDKIESACIAVVRGGGSSWEC